MAALIELCRWGAEREAAGTPGSCSRVWVHVHADSQLNCAVRGGGKSGLASAARAPRQALTLCRPSFEGR